MIILFNTSIIIYLAKQINFKCIKMDWFCVINDYEDFTHQSRNLNVL